MSTKLDEQGSIMSSMHLQNVTSGMQKARDLCMPTSTSTLLNTRSKQGKVTIA